MYLYRLFGGVLSSDIPVPELERVAEGPSTWVLTSSEHGEDEPDGELLGSDVVTGDVKVRLHRQQRGFRLAFDDTGVFDISADGSRIHWTQPPHVSIADARADLTSRVMAVAFHAAGMFCLHASAVVFDMMAVGFLAPKFHGKSTLALGLVRSGARLLTDDTLPVLEGPPARALPGIHATRLWSDSAERLALGEAQPAVAGEKLLFSGMPEDRISHETWPLDALYVLTPVAATADGPAATRTRLSPTQAALLMIAHGKLAPLLNGSEAATVFARAARLSSSVPVYTLRIVRDLDRLEEAVTTIRDWHRARTFA